MQIKLCLKRQKKKQKLYNYPGRGSRRAVLFPAIIGERIKYMADIKTEKQKVKEITDKLEEGLKELFESEKYKSYLSTMSKFHNYSFNNTLLIALQRPDATLVAGYQAWQRNFNRHVNQGERGEMV